MNKKYREFWLLDKGGKVGSWAYKTKMSAIHTGNKIGESFGVVSLIESKAVEDWREMAEKLAKQISEIKEPAEMYKAYGWDDRGGVIRKTNAVLIEYEQFKKEFL